MPPPPPIEDIRRRIAATSYADAHRLARRLRAAAKLSGARRNQAIDKLLSALREAEARLAQRRNAVPSAIEYPEELPIAEWRSELLATIGANQVVIVAGETGSGKSTQLPKLCLEMGRGVLGTIGHTQPRRIAARSIAERVAEELKSTVGEVVGYKFRFADEVGERTLVKVMTDGILLNELQRDRMLRGYDTIIVDEAHERSLNIDFLLGYLKQLLPKRPDLKVIITSATIDTARFSAHFDGAPIIEVSGRAFSVETRYRPLTSEGGEEPMDQTDGIAAAVSELTREGPGDILVFCSGEREIRDATEALRELDIDRTEVLPLFGRLSSREQHRVFASHSGRRIVVATNVAETSLTVPGIRYVVDVGTARISRFNRRTKVQRLPIEPISQASADQRAGRCGRLGPGICIRLYSVEDYLGRPEFTEPEILRTNLASVILQMAAIGLGDIESFPFVEPPDTRTVRDGVGLLEELQAVAGDAVGTPQWLTPIGKQLASIPLDPRLGRILLAGAEHHCLREMLIITSALSIVDPRDRPTGKEEHAAQMHRRFRDDTSDFASLLNLWEYITTERRRRTSNQFRRMCRDEFLNWRRIKEWQDVHAQLRAIADELGLRRNSQPSAADAIHLALLTGLITHVGSKDPDGFEYRGPRGSRFAINPGSALFKKAPPWIMAAELVETTRTWARVVAPVDPLVVEEAASHLVKETVSDPWWDAQRGTAMSNQTVTLLGLDLVANRPVMTSRFDQPSARELFIRHALVLGEWQTHHQFAAHNAAMVDEVLALEARGRRADLLVDDEALVRFYDKRLPDHIVSVRHFDRWWRQTKDADPGLLDLTLDDLIAADAGDVNDTLFPPQWVYGDTALELNYEFDPTSPTDGVTVDIPAAMLDVIDPTVFEWNVPGFRLPLITALIKSLPKALRKQFVPVPDTAVVVASAIGPGDGGLIEVLRRELTGRGGEVILPEHFDLASVPPHLRPGFRIIDSAGATVAEGRDLAALRDSLRAETRDIAAVTVHPIERAAVTTWDFGDLPRTVSLAGDDHSVTAYPALIEDEGSVAIRLLATQQEQSEAMWAGLRRLLLIQLPSPGRLMRNVLDGEFRLSLVGSPYGDVGAWMEDCLTAALDTMMLAGGGLVWNEADFKLLLTRVREGIADELEHIGRESADVLRSLHELNATLAGIPAERHEATVDDVVDQVGQFMYPGFITGIGPDKLADIGRYLNAARYRLEKLAENPGRDLERMQRVRALEVEFDRLVDALPWSHKMIDISWMLQELRVSLFAQPIGAKGPISEQRIRRALEELVRPSG